MKKYVVVAHVDGDRSVVDAVILEIAKKEPAQFYLLVPATPLRERFWAYTQEEARQLAQKRLRDALRALDGLAVDFSGGIGCGDIPEAIGDVVRAEPFDGVILAPPPSSWLDRLFGSLESQVREMVPVPVTHVVVPGARAL